MELETKAYANSTNTVISMTTQEVGGMEEPDAPKEETFEEHIKRVLAFNSYDINALIGDKCIPVANVVFDGERVIVYSNDTNEFGMICDSIVGNGKKPRILYLLQLLNMVGIDISDTGRFIPKKNHKLTKIMASYVSLDSVSIYDLYRSWYNYVDCYRNKDNPEFKGHYMSQTDQFPTEELYASMIDVLGYKTNDSYNKDYEENPSTLVIADALTEIRHANTTTAITMLSAIVGVVVICAIMIVFL